MGNDRDHHRSNKKSNFLSSPESLEDMDTSDILGSSFEMAHSHKEDCPRCSGLCFRRLMLMQRNPSSSYPYGGAGAFSSVNQPLSAYAGTTKDRRDDYGPVGSSSHQFTNRDNHSVSSGGGASSTSYYHRSDGPPLGNAVSYGLGGPSSTRNTVAEFGTPFLNGMGSYGTGTTESSFKSSYEAGYDAGLKDGYELALMDFAAQRVNAVNCKGPEDSGLVALENGGDDIGDDSGIGAGHQLHHNQNNSQHNSSTQVIDLWTSPTGQAGQSHVQNSANGGRMFDTEAYKTTKPHQAEEDGELSASAFPLHGHRHAETGENVLGLTNADKAGILHNAAKVGTRSNASSPTHSDHNDAKLSNSVPSKSRSTSCNGPKNRLPRSSFTNIVDEGRNILYPSLEEFGAACSSRQNKFRKKPASQQEKLLADFTTEVFHQPLSSRGASNEGVSTSSGNNTAAAPPVCSICITSLAEDSPYQRGKDVSRDLVGCAALKLCGHHFHISCLMQMATNDASWLTCPNCQTIHGVRIGTQPKGGMFNARKYGGNLPGFPKNSGTIEITYSFRHGKQGPEHPNPGRPYHLVGFPRVAYLPNTAQGNKVLKLLRVAFDRRLIFTVGTSATSGSVDCVVWNGIHHKTETHDSSGHGYPDPKYLDNVTMELASFGVT